MVSDLARIQQRLNAIPRYVKDAVRVALEKAAQDVVDAAKSFCPVDKGVLRDSIGWTWGKAPIGSVVVGSIGEGSLSITIYAGNEDAYYARWVEFGTQASKKGQRVADNRRGNGKRRKSYRSHPGTAAQPFFYPAYRLMKKKSSSDIRRAVAKAIREHWGK